MSDPSTFGDEVGSVDDVVTISVSPNGRVTIPVRFRETLGIDGSGRVCFTRTDTEAPLLERVPTAEEMRGFAAWSGESSTDEPASELLRKFRDADHR